MRNRSRSMLSIVVRLLLTAVLVTYVLLKVDLDQVAAGFGLSAWWGPAGAGLLLLLNIGLQWLRWHILARTALPGMSAGRSLRILLSGYPLGFLTPGKIGELGRGALVEGEHDSLSVAGLTALERAFSLLGAVGLAIIAMILSGYGSLWKWAIILLVYLTALYLAGRPYRLAALVGRLTPGLPGDFGSAASLWADRFVKGWRLSGRRAALKVYLLSILQSATVLAQLTLCYMAAGVSAPVVKVFGTWAIVLGAKYFLPITVGDVGVREGLAVIFFTDRNLPTAQAVLAALIIYFLNVLLPALAGSLVLLKGGKGKVTG